MGEEEAQEFRNLIHLDEEFGEISLDELKNFLLSPFPQGYPELRFFNWQLSLKVLPLKRELWEKTWEKRERQYYGLIERMFRDSPDFLQDGLRGGRVIESADVLSKIHGDVKRLQGTLPHIYQVVNNPEEHDIHIHRLDRLIYVFSLVNSHCPYTQGLHELAGVLYYTALAGTRKLSMTDDRAESIAFFLLFNLIVGAKLYDYYANVEDENKIKEKLSPIQKVIEKNNREFANFFFDEMKIYPSYFGVNWVSLLFAQKLQFSNLLLLWDHLLVFYDKIFEFVLMISAASILIKRKKFETLSFNDLLNELQNNKEMKVTSVLRLARSLWE
ncbi:hypothetical protein M9Y10_043626 [Tritrichomonas musculus]|uniref:Rab-GAP TBC domain-containing protein n=1 Tax=Tritrichomonas musculus TaxID=1915356 RepID=A0ABR2K093_9EUKA